MDLGPFYSPASLTIVEGDPATGKSMLITDIAARVTKGQPMPGCSAASVDPSPVVLISAEMSHASLAANFRVAGADLKKVICFNPSAGLRIPEGIPQIREIVKEMGARLVVIDPITEVLSVSINYDQGLRQALNPLLDLARSMDMAVVLVRHLSKSARRAVHAGGGSIGMTSLARSVLLAGHHPTESEQRVISISKSNVATAKSLGYRLVSGPQGVGMRVEWTGESDTTADELLCTSSSDSRSQLEEAQDFLYGILSDGPKLARRVLKQSTDEGISRPTLKRAKKSLGIKSIKRGFGASQEFWWALSDDDTKTQSTKRREIDSLCDELFYGESLRTTQRAEGPSLKPPPRRNDQRNCSENPKPDDEDGDSAADPK